MDTSTAKRGDQKKAHRPVSRPMGSSAKLECDAFVAAEIINLANTLTRVFVYSLHCKIRTNNGGVPTIGRTANSST